MAAPYPREGANPSFKDMQQQGQRSPGPRRSATPDANAPPLSLHHQSQQHQKQQAAQAHQMSVSAVAARRQHSPATGPPAAVSTSKRAAHAHGSSPQTQQALLNQQIAAQQAQIAQGQHAQQAQQRRAHAPLPDASGGLSTVQHNNGVPDVLKGKGGAEEGAGFVEAWAMQNAVYTMRNPDNCVGSPRFANMAFGDQGGTLEGEVFKRMRDPHGSEFEGGVHGDDGPSPTGPSPTGPSPHQRSPLNRHGSFGSGRRRMPTGLQTPGWEDHSPSPLGGTGRSLRGMAAANLSWDDRSHMDGNSPFRSHPSNPLTGDMTTMEHPFHTTGPLTSKLPQPLPRTETTGGMKTTDLGATQPLDRHDTVPLFVDTPVQYKMGQNILLHQWEDCPDVLVSCHSRWPQAFICQFGIERGVLEWGIDISRSCDMLWVGVTANPELDCNSWICDQPETFLVSEESTILSSIYTNYVGGAATPFPSLIPTTEGPGNLTFLVDFQPTNVGGFWCAASFRLDMDVGELWMEVAGGGNLSERVLVFQNLPRGKKLYPCLSLCNAGQIVFTKHG